jgi:type I restriction-modification system DNA methylase subunit
MSKTFDQGKDDVAKLCRYFATNQQSFLAPGVKEDHIRKLLIDPFFEALGWDIRNDSMTAPQYREVITEDSLDVEGQQKAPDYTFRVGTLPKFYVEAKKCGVNISADPAPAYQLRRYGFSAKLALSILTDFDELGVYDCASRPRPGDKASHARIQYFGFTEYPDRWREIWDVFSREAVWSGMFDQYAASKRKRGTSEVDSEFLKDIEGWRDVLARNLALRNGDLSADDLNTAVQRIIDRIVFLRMAEDRGLESYGQLHKLCEQPNIYDRFMSGLCRKADQKYNSGLFHFQKETGVSDAPDTLTPRLAVDDNALKPILQSLYFEHGSPYNFGVMPVEILGTVYERFLGKVIRLTAGHQAKVEEKPEVRKAGGVYYTPAYIVNYIVHNTIGRQIEGKSPADLAGGKTKQPFRVLDMACGSGSFLLGAYQALLDHCLMWYQANPSPKLAKALYQNMKGETRLTIAERKRILTTHIYGVDIDRQAVETTKLSLLLKALEGENDASLSQQMTLFHERALPNLSRNIKCGNSLIASDFSMVPDELVGVHAFDWNVQFSAIMKAGGFDAVIGNPPWGASLSAEEKKYLSQSYSCFQGNHDSYLFFIEKANTLLRNNGHTSFITPDSWIKVPQAEQLRRILLGNGNIALITTLPQKVFKGVSANCLIFTFTKGREPDECQINILQPKSDLSNLAQCKFDENYKVNTAEWTTSSDAQFQIFQKREVSQIINRIGDRCEQASRFLDVMQGIVPYSKENHSKETIEKRAFHSPKRLSDEYGIWIQGRAITRYFLTLKSVEYLRYGDWLHRPRKAKYFQGSRILIQEITGGHPPRIAACYCDAVLYHDPGIISCLVVGNLHLKFLLGILNSRFLSWYHRYASPKGTRHAFPKVLIGDIRVFPIPMVQFSNPAEKALHNKLVALVEKMLALAPRLRGATSESEKAVLQNAVTTTDAEIDRLVYELYGLTEEEIKIVEGES